jgi:hypothetical protein
VHRIEKKRNARVKAREAVRRSLEESHRVQITNTSNRYKNIAIRYETDTADVIPRAHKLEINSERYLVDRKDQPREVESDNSPGFEVINRDEKILMSGKIPVIDAEAEIVTTDTVLLTPRIVHSHQRVSKTARVKEVTDDVEYVDSGEDDTAESVPTFEERLQSNDIAIEGADDTPEASQHVLAIYTDKSRLILSSLRYLLYAVTVLFALGTLSTEKISYQEDAATSRSYDFKGTGISDYVFKNKDISSIR